MNEEISDYIVQAQKHGLTEMEIKQNLLGAGWEAAAVEEAFVFSRALETKNQTPGKPANSGYVSQPLSQNIKPIIMPGQQPAASPFHQNINISEQHFSSNSSAPIFKKPTFWAALILILFLGAGAYGYYQYVYASPAKILEKYFAGRGTAETFSASFSLSYTDKNAPLGMSGDSATQELTLGVSGDGFYDNSDKNTPKTEATTKLFTKSGGSEFSVELQTMNIGKVIYFNLDKIPQIKNLLDDKNISWLKLDLDELQKYASENFPASMASSTESLASNVELKNKIVKIWKDSKFFTPGTTMAKEDINGTPTYRLEPQIDSAKINEAVINSINTIQSYQKSEDPKLTDEQKRAISLLIEKFKVKDLKIWIGQKDYKLYRMNLVLAAPSISDFSLTNGGDYIPALSTARAKSRDAKRLADIRQMASALELYANENNGGYPEGQNGVPIDISPKFIGVMPTAPTPTDGNCTDYFNTYWYTPTGKANTKNGKTTYPDYQLTFCVGDTVSGYSAGIGKLTRMGIETGIACPSSQENCVKLQTGIDEQVSEEINKMTFGAEISYQTSLKDYGSTRELKEPEGAVDIIDLITKTLGQTRAKAADAKRLADIRQLASAQELYFNDFNSYPDNQNKLVPNYIGALPTSPTPAEGSCTEQDNAYTYKFINKDKYELSFCLGATTGGYAAGKHTLSQAGIQ